jgi:hypothetical protein
MTYIKRNLIQIFLVCFILVVGVIVIPVAYISAQGSLTDGCSCGNCDYSCGGDNCSGGDNDYTQSTYYTQSAYQYSPKGYHDSANCTTVTGWTCDQNSYNTALNVRVYADGTARRGTYLGSTVANITREPAVAAQCGTIAAHGFSFTLPSSIKNNAAHSIYVYGVDDSGGSANKLLTGSPKSTGVCAPDYTQSSYFIQGGYYPNISSLTLTVSPKTVRSGESSTVTWDGGNAESCTIIGGGLNATTASGTAVIENITGEATIIATCTLGPNTSTASSTIKVLPTPTES